MSGRIGDHTCWTIWGPASIDPPARLRKLTRIRRQIGERSYRDLRYSMSIAQAGQALRRLVREMWAIKSELAQIASNTEGSA